MRVFTLDNRPEVLVQHRKKTTVLLKFLTEPFNKSSHNIPLCFFVLLEGSKNFTVFVSLDFHLIIGLLFPSCQLFSFHASYLAFMAKS